MPQYDCTERLERNDQEFEATLVDANWHTFLATTPGMGIGTQVSAIAFPSLNPTDFLTNGFFAPSASSSFSFGPPLNLKEKSMWLELRVGTTTIPPIYLRRKGTWHIPGATVPASRLEPLLALNGELVITFFDVNGRLLVRETIPTSTLRDAVGELPKMYGRALEKSRNPAKLCSEVIMLLG